MKQKENVVKATKIYSIHYEKTRFWKIIISIQYKYFME